LQQADIERAYIYRGGEFGSDITLGVMGLFQGDASARIQTCSVWV